MSSSKSKPNISDHNNGGDDTTTPTTTPTTTFATPMRAYRVRCGECEACLLPDCLVCDQCVRKKKYGGDGSSRQACLRRKCPFLRFIPKASPGGRGSASPSGTKKRPRNPAASPVVETSTSDGNSEPKTPKKRERRRQPSRLNSSSSTISTAAPGSASVKSNQGPSSLVAVTFSDAPAILYRRPPSLIQVPDDAEMEFRGSSSSSEKGSSTGALPEKPKRNQLDAPPLHFAGQPVPCKRYGVCGTCGLDDESKDTIVLCDGPGCGQEFHMQCCRPPLMCIPEGDFYCFDCSREGSTEQLKAFLDEMEAQREAHLEWGGGNDSDDANPGNLSFVDQLILKDIQDHQTQLLGLKERELEKLSGEEKRNKILAAIRPPCSQLDIFHQKRSSSSETNDYNIDCPSILGKAIRLYCPKSNDYHTGRILKVSRPSRREEPSTKHILLWDSECLVRFQAGRDNRKTSLTRWIRLEEHSLAIATEFAWGLFATDLEETENKWLPTKLWARSSRELVMSMHLLQESVGQIRYRDWRLRRGESQQPQSQITEQTWILGEVLGHGTYKLLNVATETRKISKSSYHTSPDSSAVDRNTNGSDSFSAILNGSHHSCNTVNGLKSGSHNDRLAQITSALEQVEREEEERVREWTENVPLLNTFHEKALTCQDESALEPLGYTNRVELIQPSPSVRTGLDRMLVLDRVAAALHIEEATNTNGNTGNQFRTKDLALSLSCTVVESDYITACIKSQNTRERRNRGVIPSMSLPTF